MRLDVTADELRDFLTFRRMITPLLIQALFWILSAIVMIIRVVLLIVGDGSGQRVAGFWMIFLGPLAVRVYLDFHGGLPHQRDPDRHPCQHDARVVPLPGQMKTASAPIPWTRA